MPPHRKYASEAERLFERNKRRRAARAALTQTKPKRTGLKRTTPGIEAAQRKRRYRSRHSRPHKEPEFYAGESSSQLSDNLDPSNLPFPDEWSGSDDSLVETAQLVKDFQNQNPLHFLLSQDALDEENIQCFPSISANTAKSDSNRLKRSRKPYKRTQKEIIVEENTSSNSEIYEAEEEAVQGCDEECTHDPGEEDRKPPYKLGQLIVQALASASDQQLDLKGLYTYFTKHFPYYRKRKAEGNWKNCIRQTLTVSPCFSKANTPESYDKRFGWFWRIDSDSQGLLEQAYIRKGHRGVPYFRSQYYSSSTVSASPTHEDEDDLYDTEYDTKPPYKLGQLLVQAIASTPDHQLDLKGLYSYFIEHFPYYKKRRAEHSWKNSIRQTLTTSPYFYRVRNGERITGSFWRIDDQAEAELIDQAFTTKWVRGVWCFRQSIPTSSVPASSTPTSGASTNLASSSLINDLHHKNLSRTNLRSSRRLKRNSTTKPQLQASASASAHAAANLIWVNSSCIKIEDEETSEEEPSQDPLALELNIKTEKPEDEEYFQMLTETKPIIKEEPS